jgi:uncharacterized protein
VSETRTAASNRTWPAPDEPAMMEQTWNDLLFAHWALAPDRVRPLVPAQLPLDTRDGMAWVAVTPFRMTGVRWRGLPPVPGASAFPELNLRTYVRVGDKPGVYFFSLDAGNPLAVAAARLFLGLPYYWARMRSEPFGAGFSYSSERGTEGRDPVVFRAYYEPDEKVFVAIPGTLEHWLIERYCLYTVRDGRVDRLEIDHDPWPLQHAHARIERNELPAAAGLALDGGSPDLLHFARRLDVRAWRPRSAGGGADGEG